MGIIPSSNILYFHIPINPSDYLASMLRPLLANLLILGILLSANTPIHAGETPTTTTLSSGYMALGQQCRDCIKNHYRMIPLSVSLNRGGYRVKLATSLLELRRPNLGERIRGMGEFVITLSCDHRIASRSWLGEEVKLKLPSESDPELGNGSTDIQMGLKVTQGMAGLWLQGKLAYRWRRESDSSPLNDSASLELGLAGQLNREVGLGLRTVYRNSSANISQVEREWMPYLGWKVDTSQRITLYVLHSEQGERRDNGGGIQYSYRY